MTLGPIMLDLTGPELLDEERELLRHPLVGGVVLFDRNYRDPSQLARLVAGVHALREPRLLVAVDQEGGRVQRLRAGFTTLPTPATFGRIYDESPEQARELARSYGWLMAVELRAVGLDLSFAPVLDLGTGRSVVIGDRALHRDPEAVAALAQAVMGGMSSAGMAAVGKHFPGHGNVEGDSHVMLPVDGRDLDAIRQSDLLAFERMIRYGLPAVMAAHVRYPAVDPQPAGFSRYWLGRVLREELGFSGAVLSDDLGMAGASGPGDMPARARAALAAGCDMALVCNDRTGAQSVLEALDNVDSPLRAARLARLHGRHPVARDALLADERYRAVVRRVASLEPAPELDLGGDTPM